ncbi:hypothetical protein PAAG_02348 [Paracoccidioides lutzii Pb01]|uniref:Uncharacterized protein n=1 Tax=Paracoccidioides lutzii (strain ATCC MYA-826 / Pb01) TaxID=502779 RepID=C1GUM5_PARBA|nr:hypothetical protein PAAG_02348 [Paracoccidioides lutzii Pb01]EEH40293.2 hypothetical protein PAAG_02348 [Paracoccidioides lutzii Pb01]
MNGYSLWLERTWLIMKMFSGWQGVWPASTVVRSQAGAVLSGDRSLRAAYFAQAEHISGNLQQPSAGRPKKPQREYQLQAKWLNQQRLHQHETGKALRSPSFQGVLGSPKRPYVGWRRASQVLNLDRGYIDTDTGSPKYAEASRGPYSKVEPGLGPPRCQWCLGDRAQRRCSEQQRLAACIENGEERLHSPLFSSFSFPHLLAQFSLLILLSHFDFVNLTTSITPTTDLDIQLVLELESRHPRITTVRTAS